jgi:hypothetical protein
MQVVAARLELLERYHFQHFLRRPPSSARSRCLVGRFQHRTPACGVRCVGVEGSRWLIWSKHLQVLWALVGKVAPEEEVVDSYLREERPWLVLLLRVEDFSEMKGSQRNCWQARDDCPGETPKEVGVNEVTILGSLEQKRARSTTHRKAPPLWNL